MGLVLERRNRFLFVFITTAIRIMVPLNTQNALVGPGLSIDHLVMPYQMVHTLVFGQCNNQQQLCNEITREFAIVKEICSCNSNFSASTNCSQNLELFGKHMEGNNDRTEFLL